MLWGCCAPRGVGSFVLLPQRCVVERAFDWLNHSHCPIKSYERFTRTDDLGMYPHDPHHVGASGFR